MPAIVLLWTHPKATLVTKQAASSTRQMPYKPCFRCSAESMFNRFMKSVPEPRRCPPPPKPRPAP